MSVEWTGLGPELMLRLDRSRSEPLHSQLERELRDAIRNGRLRVGERLPSSRALAAELGLSRGLVLDSYRQLQAEGYLTARMGSATRVASSAQPPIRPASEAKTVERLSIDFLPGVPDLTSFPRRDWAWAVRESCRRATATELGYGDPRGDRRLREVLASYLRRVRAAAAEPEQIVVSSGYAQGLNLALRALARRGIRQVATEDPGDLSTGAVLRRLGLDVLPIPVDGKGIVTDKLEATAARAVVLTPAHQSPTGVVLSPERRRDLLAWAAQRKATIIEDDYDAEFRYDSEPVGSLQGLDPERVILMGTVSKSLAPTLRLGWLVCPPALVETVAEEKLLADRGSPGLDQVALAVLLESGRYDRHLRRMRTVYANRRDVLVHALAEHGPDVGVHGLAAGFHAVARLPGQLDEDAIVAAARARSIGLHGMSEFRSNGSTGPPELVLGFGNLTTDAIQRGIREIRDLIRVERTRQKRLS
jgi:GntR family transcriptional regulator / MocR family aminotransferase